MKIQFSKDMLQKAINALAKVSQNKTSSNLPGAIYITTKNGKVEMQANDYEIGIRITIDANIIEEGTIVLSTSQNTDRYHYIRIQCGNKTIIVKF